MIGDTRQWRCPGCGRVFRIPIASDGPMVCPQCSGIPSDDVADDSPHLSSDDKSGLIAEFDPDTVDLKFESRSSTPFHHQMSEDQRVPRSPRLKLHLFLILAAIAVAVLFFPKNRQKPGSSMAPFDSSAHRLFSDRPRLRLNPNSNAPLVLLADISAEVPVRATLQLDDGERQWTYRASGPASDEYQLAVIGLRPGRDHVIRVQLEDETGKQKEISHPIMVTTPPLPEDFPPIEVRASFPESMEPGVTCFPVNLWVNDKRSQDYGYLIALDEAGEVTWYLRTNKRVVDMRLLENGHLLFDNHYQNLYEVDLLGNVHKHWVATRLGIELEAGQIPVDTDTMHHEFIPLPSGNFLTLSTELRTIPDFPTHERDTSAPRELSRVIGDAILEFQPDGTVVNRWPLFDLLDINRLGYGSLGGFWKPWYDGKGTKPACRDWSHANALIYDPSDDTMIVSLRHQDCLLKVSRATGELVWILGNPTGWGEEWKPYRLEPEEELRWPLSSARSGTDSERDNPDVRQRELPGNAPAPSYSGGTDLQPGR